MIFNSCMWASNGTCQKDRREEKKNGPNRRFAIDRQGDISHSMCRYIFDDDNNNAARDVAAAAVVHRLKET